MWTQSGKYIIPILATIVAGCTTMGTGTGSTPSGGSPTVFSWVSSDGVTRTMSAAMPGGQTYRGQYFQITKNTTVDSIGPLWGQCKGLYRCPFAAVLALSLLSMRWADGAQRASALCNTYPQPDYHPSRGDLMTIGARPI